jgi:hypothetical protein
MLFKVNAVLFTFDALAGGIIALWKSVVITVKVETRDGYIHFELCKQQKYPQLPEYSL